MTLEKEFPIAVDQDLGPEAYRRGLQALKAADRSLLEPNNPRKCYGSADIDTCLARQQPQSPRWDYVVAYDETLHFIEVHPAHSSEVNAVIKKKEWLRSWLRHTELGKLKASNRFHWVSSGKIAITPNSRQMRAAVQYGLRPVRKLML